MAPRTSNLTCLDCGAPQTLAAPEGLCPGCLARAAVEWGEESGGASVGDLVEGRCFGDYELVREIARGGMGVVFEARQLGVNRTVALKVLAGGAAAGREFVHRFHTEAAAAARLDHPHIVPIHEFGEHDGTHFLAMPFLDGGTLQARIAQSRPSPLESARLLLRLAEAVEHAHRRGVLHRDLKPGNVLLDAEGSPRIADFGLARLPEDDRELTLSHAVLGTGPYLAPEVALGGATRATIASDVYGLGAILYELLTGRPPFVAPSLPELLKKIGSDEPRAPRLADPRVPADLETVCLKCLEKDPSRRYATAQELADDLDRWLRDEPVRARPAPAFERVWRWCGRKPALAGAFGAAALFFMAGLAGVLWQWRAADLNATAARTAATLAEAHELKARRAQYASDMNLAHAAVQEGDFFRARQLLERHMSSQETGNASREPDVASAPRTQFLTSNPKLTSPVLRGWEWHYLWLLCQGDQEFILGSHSNGVTAVGFLPDGKTAYSAGWDGAVRIWDLESRREKDQLVQEDGVFAATVSPDGQQLVTAISNPANAPGFPLRLWNLKRKTLILTLSSNHWPRASMTCSPNGRYLAVAGVDVLRLWDLTESRAITNWPYAYTQLAPRGIAFSPDGRVLALSHEPSGRIQLVGMASLALLGELTGHTNEVTALAFSPTGDTLASASLDRTVRVWDVPRGRPIASRQFADMVGSLCFSPDERELACTFSFKQQALILSATNAHILRELVGHRGALTSIAYSPDGKNLLTGSRDGTVRVWNAAEKPKLESARTLFHVANWNAYGLAQAISQDGHHVLTAFADDTFSLWNSRTLAERLRLPLPVTNVDVAAIAPGGESVAFCHGEREIDVWNSVTRQARRLATLDTNAYASRLAFSSSGHLLAAAGSGVWIFDVATAQSRLPIEDNGFPGTAMELLFADKDRKLVLGCFDGTIVAYDLDSPGRKHILRGHTEQVRGLALLPDGRTLFSVSGDGSLRIWDLLAQRVTARFNPSRIGYVCAALTPDGRRFVAGSGDGIITVWDTESLQEVVRLNAHEGRVQRVAFTSDGGAMVSIGGDQLRVWRGESLAETGPKPPSQPGN